MTSRDYVFDENGKFKYSLDPELVSPKEDYQDLGTPNEVDTRIFTVDHPHHQKVRDEIGIHLPKPPPPQEKVQEAIKKHSAKFESYLKRSKIIIADPKEKQRRCASFCLALMQEDSL